jgi:hypothetical protein
MTKLTPMSIITGSQPRLGNDLGPPSSNQTAKERAVQIKMRREQAITALNQAAQTTINDLYKVEIKSG